MNRAVITLVVWTLVGGYALTACVQFPTEKQSSVDLRPQLSFSVANPALNPGELEVLVDGLSVGAVGTFLAGQQAVRVLPGSHVVTIRQGGRVLQEEQVFLGDGMTRTFVVQ